MAEIAFRDLEIGDAGWLVMQHARLYARDEGFDIRFEAIVARVLAEFIETRDPSCERAFIAHRGDERLGSIFCSRHDAETARLRMFLVLPEARGCGLGRRLLSECMGFARDTGFRRMMLHTHKSHAAACALYEKVGWRCTRSFPVENFGQQLVEMRWQVDL